MICHHLSANIISQWGFVRMEHNVYSIMKVLIVVNN
jgi:hypothetical protein